MFRGPIKDRKPQKAKRVQITSTKKYEPIEASMSEYYSPVSKTEK